MIAGLVQDCCKDTIVLTMWVRVEIDISKAGLVWQKSSMEVSCLYMHFCQGGTLKERDTGSSPGLAC